MEGELETMNQSGSLYFGRYTPKGSSKVWKHFFLLRDYPSKAFCSHCCSDPLTVATGEGVMTYHEGGKSGTSSMKKHLERKHNIFLDMGRIDPGGGKSPTSTEVSSPQVTGTESPSLPMNLQLTLPDSFFHGSSSTTGHRLEDGLLRSFVRNVIIGDLKPFQVIEDGGLREFLRDLQPKCKLEDAATVRDAFNIIHGEIFNGSPIRRLKEEDEEQITLSGYGFQFPLAKTEFMFGLVVSWIDRNWIENRMVCYSAGDKESDLGSVLSETLTKHCFPAQGTELFAVVSDGSSVVEASDMQATIFPCGPPVLQSTLDSVLDGPDADPEVLSLLVKVRRLADYLHAFLSWNNSNKAFWREMDGVEPLEFTREDPDRLVPICDLLRTLCSKKEVIEALSSRNNFNQEAPHLSDDEFVTLSQLASVLDSLREAAGILECQSHVRLSLFFPVLKLLLQKLAKSHPILVSASESGERLEINEDQLQSPARTVRSRLRAHLRQRLDSLNEHQVSLMSLAAALDPRFKALKFMSAEEQETVWNRLLELVREKEEVDSKALLPLEPLVKRSKLASFFGDVVATEGATCGPKEELEAYRKMPQVLVTSDPLRWWQEHGDSFSRLRGLARRYLPIPMQRPQRSRVSPDSVRFLRAYMDRDTLARLLFAHENCDHG